MTCNHKEDKTMTHLDKFDSVGELYLCECGALIDIVDPISGFGERSLNAKEIQGLITKLMWGVIDKIVEDVRSVGKRW